MGQFFFVGGTCLRVIEQEQESDAHVSAKRGEKGGGQAASGFEVKSSRRKLTSALIWFVSDIEVESIDYIARKTAPVLICKVQVMKRCGVTVQADILVRLVALDAIRDKTLWIQVWWKLGLELLRMCIDRAINSTPTHDQAIISGFGSLRVFAK